MADYYSGNGGGSNGYSQGPGPGREDDKKIFVGGLGWQTTSDEVKQYFSQFGEVTSVNLKVDSQTGRSRGFAFVTFSQSSTVQQVMSTTEHTISDRRVETKLIKFREAKVFVGGLKGEMSDDSIRSHFETFGKISQLDLPKDRNTNQRKNFCFITFENENDVRNLLKLGKTTVCGVEVGVKKAEPRGAGAAPNAGYGGGGGGGGGGYGYGGAGGYGAGGGYGDGGYGAGYGGYDDGYGGYGGGYEEGYGAGYEDYGGYGGGYDDGYGGGAGYGSYGSSGGGYGGAAAAGGGFKPRGGGGARGASARGSPATPVRGGAAAARGGGGGGAATPRGVSGGPRGARGARGGRGRARPQPY